MFIEKLLHTVGAVLAVAMLSTGMAHAGVPVGWISVDRSEGDPNHFTNHVGDFPGGLDAYVSADGYALSAHENSIEILGTASLDWPGANMYFNGLVLTGNFLPGETDFYLAANNLAGFDASRIWLDFGRLYIDFASLSTLASSRLVINFGTVAAIPEPETYVLMLGGFALIGVMARRRNSARLLARA